MSKIFNSLLNDVKGFALETSKEVVEDLKLSAKEKIKGLVVEKFNQSENNKLLNEPNESNSDKEIELIQDSNNNFFNEDSSEIKYLELINKKVQNGIIPEASRYFLKLNREKLGISEKRAKELELSVINKA